MKLNHLRSAAEPVKIGGTLYRSWNFHHAETGEPFDFIADTAGAWVGRARFKGDADVYFHSTDPEAQGTVTFDAVGNVALEMSSAATALLQPGRVRGDLELVDPLDGEVYSPFHTIELLFVAEETI